MPEITAKLLEIWRAADRASTTARMAADAALAAADAADAAAVAARRAALDAGVSVESADITTAVARDAYDDRQRRLVGNEPATPALQGEQAQQPA